MIDTYGREISYLRLSVTDLCDLRCRYCMPEQGVCKKHHEDMLTEEEMIQAVRAAASLGITKLRITGGEPLVKKNILSICRRAAEVQGIRELCMTTNGIRLPQLAKPLQEAGVQRLNISLDTINADKYAYITRQGSLKAAIAGIEAALQEGFTRIKINTVLIGGFNDNEICDLAALTKRWPVDVRFIELMPMLDHAEFGPSAYVPCAEVLRQLPELQPSEQDDGVARLYHLPGAYGNIGLISPLSSHFCADCNRIRLTADGKIKSCLHSSAEYPIKGLGFEAVVQQFQRSIFEKPQWHGELSAAHRSRAGRSMNRIGG